MRTNNLFRMVILIFLLSTIFVTAVGCQNPSSDKLPDSTETDNQLSDQNTPTDSEQAMTKKWKDVISNADTEIKGVDIKKYIIQPAYSSITTKVQEFTLKDATVIANLIDIVRELNVSFEDFEFDESGMNEFYTSHIGKQKIEIMLIDSAGNEIFGLCLYENGDIDIFEAREITETKKTYRHTYRVYFENSNSDVFAAFNNFYENNLT